MDTAVRLVARGLLEGQEISENRGPAMALAIYIIHGVTLVICFARHVVNEYLCKILR